MHRARNHGFTLIELLVVIAIIAILAGMLMAVFGIMQARSYGAQATSVMSRLAVCIEQYKDDAGHYPYIDSNWGAFTARKLTVASDGTITAAIPATPTPIIPWRVTNENLLKADGIGGYLDKLSPKLPDSIFKDTGDNPDSEVVDPWGVPYMYVFTQSDGAWPDAVGTIKVAYRKNYILQSIGTDTSYAALNSVTGNNQDNVWYTNKGIW